MNYYKTQRRKRISSSSTSFSVFTRVPSLCAVAVAVAVAVSLCTSSSLSLVSSFAILSTPTNSISSSSRKKTTADSAAATTRKTSLNAVSKAQTVIYDGAEFISILSFLCKSETEYMKEGDNKKEKEEETRILLCDDFDDKNNMGGSSTTAVPIRNNLPLKKAGYLKFVTGTSSSSTSTSRIIAVAYQQQDQPPPSSSEQLTRLDNDIYVYTDSIATIPKGISESDAISTASAALCGVHCGMPTTNGNNKGKTVILGGGDYACFTAKAISSLGHEVHLVTTRPMSLKDTPLNPLRGSNVNTMPPTKQQQQQDDVIGFSEALKTFDTCIDTLGDEARFSKIRTVQDGIDRFCGNTGVISKLALENKCQRYVSTVTRSQRFVLEEGILFARDPVLNYQKQIENDKEILSTAPSYENYQLLPPPRDYGATLQKLFDNKIIYPTDRNENGGHGRKKAFVRGCSFPDYAEIEIWPQDSTDGAAVRFGFPGIRELTLEARMDTMIRTFDNAQGGGGSAGSTTNASIMTDSKGPTKNDDTNEDIKEINEKKKKKKKVENPFVIEIESLGDITDEIRNTKKDAILFVSAPYCRLCRSIGPQYNRMARLSKEELNSDLQFAKATTGTNKAMKQLTFTLKIDSVPTFVLFRKGERYGEPLNVGKLPSVKLNRAIEGLKTGKDWDPEILEIKEGGTKMRTKI